MLFPFLIRHARRFKPGRHCALLVAPACVLLLLILVGGCGREPAENAGQFAYVAPTTVNLRSQLNQKNSTVAVLQHGERVTLLDVRRRYVKVRTRGGAEGWTDSLDLLSPAEMRRIQKERQEAAQLPSEGTATAYEKANLHLEPDRKSPAFSQIPEGGAVSVLKRTLSPRLSPPRPTITFVRPRPVSRRQRRASRTASRQPPKPPLPAPPSNWRAPWGTSDPESTKQITKPKNALPEKPVVLDAWNLIRTPDGRSGWVLARNLMMSIPDEVAQYAAGKHITGYFELGTVHDERDGIKHDWLWTTVSDVQPVDFDSWRVFIWNRRRHRYETSYRQRDVEGHFPVQVDVPASSAPGRTFKLITRDNDGKLRQRSYRFDGTLVHLAGSEDYVQAEAETRNASAAKAPKPTPHPGWFASKWSALKQKLFSR